MKILFFTILFFTELSFAFVSGPSAVDVGENLISLGSQIERGKVEPNENRSSFQDAQIDIYRLKYVRGFEGFLGLKYANVYTEYAGFKSAEERVGANLFYESDQGAAATIGLAGDFVHELEKQFGFYLQVSPIRNYNKNKFSNPRLDLFAFGLTSAFEITDRLFQKNLIHYGSGDGTSQNSYLAVDTGFGYKLNSLLKREFTLLGSLFLEADTSERKDNSYDSVFSPTGTQDRIRAFKYGTVIGADMALAEQMSLSFNYLQKLGGYDARSTQIYTLNLGYKF